MSKNSSKQLVNNLEQWLKTLKRKPKYNRSEKIDEEYKVRSRDSREFF